MGQGRGLKKQARKVLKDQKARKELFSMLKKCGNEDGEVPNICIYLVESQVLKSFYTILSYNGPFRLLRYRKVRRGIKQGKSKRISVRNSLEMKNHYSLNEFYQ